MPEHFHVLITPSVTLERAVQFIKGGFSFRAKKELESNMEIWQSGFSDHRIRDIQDYDNHVGYIFQNPVGRNLAERAEEYPYCSAFRPLAGLKARPFAIRSPHPTYPFKRRRLSPQQRNC